MSVCGKRAALLALPVILAGCASARVIVIRDVAIVDVAHASTRAHQSVVIRDSLIESITDARPAPARAHVIDGAGKFLIPGLWDMHVHAALHDDALTAMLRSGVTGVRDMGGDPQLLEQQRRRIRAGVLAGPRIVYAGPLLRGPTSPNDSSEADAWVIHNAAEGRAAVDSLAALHVDFVKVHEGLSREAVKAILAEALSKGMTVVGHVPASMTPAELADAGVKSIEHLEFVPDSAPELGLVLQRLAADGTWLDPTISSFRYWAPAQFPQIMERFRAIAAQIRAAGVPILAGTDWSGSLQSRGASPASDLQDELSLLVDAGYSPAEALRAATSNPARFLNRSKSLGSIEAGKLADMVLLAGNPLEDIENTRRVVLVISNGREIH